MGEKIKDFFKGRYGQDQFGTFLLILAAISMILRIIIKSDIFYIVTLGLLIYANFRVMSKNIYARSNENMKYLSYKNGLIKYVTWKYLSIFGKDGYKYIKCQTCNQELKVPKNKGKIKISCPKCNSKIITRS